MKYIGKNSISNLMKVFMFVFMGITVAISLLLPWLVNLYVGPNGSGYAKIVLLCVLYPCGICGLFVENELRKMFNTLVNKDPFVIENVNSLNRMGYAMILIFVIFVFKVVMLNTIMTMFICFASILLCAFCFILADVFYQAVLYKNDIDLTV